MPSSKNPWAGTMEPLVDANLTGNPWYLVADPANLAAFGYGYLEAMAGPDVAVRQGFDLLGVEMRVALHFAVYAIEPRAAWRNPGA